MDRNFWLSLLGLNDKSKPADIKKAWRQRAHDTHPDHGGDPAAFREVTHAYKMLTDESYRQGQDNVQNAQRQQNLGLNMKVHVEWIDAFLGRTVIVSWNRIHLDDQNKPTVPLVEIIDTESIDIEPGFKGKTYTFEGKGLAKGDVRGDTYILILVLEDKRYRYIDEKDIMCNEEVPLDILLTGGKLDVETPWGMRTMVVKPGTMPGTRIAIKKAGVGRDGTLHVNVAAKFPGEKELKSRAYQGMRIDWGISTEEEMDPEEEKLMQDFIRFNE